VKILVLTLIMLLSVNLQAQETIISFELNDGFSQSYNINEISNIRITKNVQDMGISIHYRDSLKKSYSTKLLSRVNFSSDFLRNTKLNVYFTESPKVFNLPDVDSLKFEPYQDPAIYGIKICGDVWMPENLNVDQYSNGDIIPEAKTDLEWMSANSNHKGVWCYMYNDGNYGEIYGRLYNWYAVNDARGLAPDGWHIPSVEEWDNLISCAGGYEIGGGNLKQTGTQQAKTGFWVEPNSGAKDKFEFSGLPGGWRYFSIGEFAYPGRFGVWWSSANPDNINSYFWILRYDNATIKRESNSKGCGFSVRCVKD
jgi:uncharacterized protein (TIGR02145 family)